MTPIIKTYCIDKNQCTEFEIYHVTWHYRNYLDNTIGRYGYINIKSLTMAQPIVMAQAKLMIELILQEKDNSKYSQVYSIPPLLFLSKNLYRCFAQRRGLIIKMLFTHFMRGHGLRYEKLILNLKGTDKRLDQ